MLTPRSDGGYHIGVFSPQPTKVARFLAGWLLLSLSLPPFFHLPVFNFWLLPLGLCYLLLLFFLPRLWLYVLPPGVAALSLASVTGRPLFNELDFLFLLTLCSGLMFHRFRIQVYRPSLPMAMLGGLIFIAVLGFSSWQAFFVPPHQLYENALSTPEYSYFSIKGLLWAVLLVPMWGHSLAMNKQASQRALIRGLSIAGLFLLLGVLSGTGPVSDPNRQLDPVLPLIPLLVPAALYGCLYGRVVTRWLGALGITSLLAVGVVAGSLLTTASITVAAGLFLGLEWGKHRREGPPIPLRTPQISLALAGFCLIAVVANLLTALERGLSPQERYGRWQVLLDDGSSLIGSGPGSTPGSYAAIEPQGTYSPRAFAVLKEGSTTLIQLPADPQLRVAQRLRVSPGRDYKLAIRARSEEGGRLTFSLCEHPLPPSPHPGSGCETTELELPGTPGEFKTLEHTLHSGAIGSSKSLDIWPSLFTLTNSGPGGTVDIDFVALSFGDINRLRNSSFSEGLDHWFTKNLADRHPGQARNLYLQWLVEFGWLGLALLVGLVILLIRTYWLPHAKQSMVTVYISGVCALCFYGLLESPLVSPRASWLFYFYLISGLASLRLYDTQSGEGQLALQRKGPIE